MSQFQNYFENNKRNAIHKWIHYFDIYDFWFKKYRNRPIVILEIGIYQGGSLNMWRDYFGEEAKIFAIDINPLCKQFETVNTKIFIGSQEDKEFLKYVKSQVPKFDILIDDGGHTMNQQIVSFEELYEHIKDDGIYLCEDLHTSYWKEYGGGYKNSNSFIEYSKNFIDSINAWHSRDISLKVNEFTNSTYSLHYYDSILVIQKGLITKPFAEIKGEIIISLDNFPTPILKLGDLKKTKLLLNIKKQIKKFIKYSRSLFQSSKRISIQGENKIDRFVPTEKIFFGKKLYIHDIASFNLCNAELFQSEMYKFKANSSNPHIIDCGANLGMSIIYFKQLYPNATIIAFEADDYIFNFLEKNIESFGYKDVELINKAVWNCDDTLSFIVEGGAGGRLEKETTIGEYKKVTCTSLKKYLIGKKVDFLKIDIEGAEYEVIKDCENEIKNIDYLFIEYHSMPGKEQNLHKILEIVEKAGFSYHIKEAYTTKYPFIERTLNFGMDLQLNIFCYKKK
jgi:FkbM family methyltransferase